MKFKKSLGAFLVPLLSILLAFVIGGINTPGIMPQKPPTTAPASSASKMPPKPVRPVK